MEFTAKMNQSYFLIISLGIRSKNPSCQGLSERIVFTVIMGTRMSTGRFLFSFPTWKTAYPSIELFKQQSPRGFYFEGKKRTPVAFHP